MKKRLFILLFVIYFSIVLASCGSTLGYDTLIIGTTASFDKVTPDNYNFDVYSKMLSNMPLVCQNENGEYEGLLCDYEVKTSDKGFTDFCFTIKENAMWHDGKPVTADDIIFTLDYLKENSTRFKLHESVESIEKLSDNSVKFIFKTSNFTQLDNFASYHVFPKHIFEGKNLQTFDSIEATIGNGPYKFVSQNNDNNTLLFERVENHFMGTPKYKNIIFKTYTNNDTLGLALKTGEIDFIYNYATTVPLEMVESFKNNSNITTEAFSATNNPYVIIFNENNTKMSLNYRMAISYAIDYEAFKNIHGSSYATVGSRGIIAKGNTGYTKTDSFVKDYTKANLYMENDGYTKNDDGFYYKDGVKATLNLVARNDGSAIKFTRAAETIKEDLKKFGIDVTVDAKATAQLFQQATGYQSTSNEACITSFTQAGVKLDHGMLTRYLYGPLNHFVQSGNINDKAYLDLIDELDSCKTEQAYLEATKKIQEYYSATCPVIALMNDSMLQAYSSKLTNMHYDATYGLLNMKTWYSIEVK